MNKFKTEIKWGILFTIAGLLWVLLEKTMGWHDLQIDKHPIYTNFFAIVAIVIFILALREKRNNDLGGSMSWKQGFVSGIIISGVVALLAPLSQYITHTIISPKYFTNAITHAVDANKMTLESAETYFSLGSYIIQSVFFALVSGVVTSAIVAMFLKKK